MYRTQYGQIYLGLVDLTLHVLKVVAAGCLLIEEEKTDSYYIGNNDVLLQNFIHVCCYVLRRLMTEAKEGKTATTATLDWE